MLRLVALFCLQMLVIDALAGTDEAMAFYEKKDYANAYAEFMRMAEIGDHLAQFNIGVMYYHGEQVAQDTVQAYAWMALACQGGNKQWSEISGKIYSTLDDAKQKQADAAKQELMAKFSDAVVAEQLAPGLLQDGDSANRLRVIKRVAPIYPIAMQRNRQPGWAEILFTVAADGTTRNHIITFASDKAFIPAVIEAVKGWQYQPATVNGKPVETYGEQLSVHFDMKGQTFDAKKIRELVQTNLEKAEKGGPAVHYSYAHFLEVLPSYTDVKLDNNDYNRWYWRAASEGYGPAQFSLAKNLLYGKACTADSVKSLRWLQRAAEQGQPDAQYLLAIEMLSGVRLARNSDVAIKWLQKAADAHNPHAQLKLAWLYATSPDEKLRNAALAKEYVARVDDEYIDHRTLFEVRAAVAAAASDFKAAVEWQRKAGDETAKYELPMDAENEKLASYQAGKAWIEPS